MVTRADKRGQVLFTRGGEERCFAQKEREIGVKTGKKQKKMRKENENRVMNS